MRAATFEEAKSWEALFKLNTLIVCCTFCDVYPCNKRVGVENRQVKKKSYYQGSLLQQGS